MPGCCAVGCTNRTEKGFSMRKLPKDPVRRRLWASKIKRKNNENPNQVWEPPERACICEVHFEDDQWEDRALKKLKPDAVPTIFEYNTEKSRLEPPRKKRKYSPQESEKGCCSNSFSTQAVASDLQEQLTSANSKISDLEAELLSTKQALADLKKQMDDALLCTRREIFTLAEENKKLKEQLQQQGTSTTNNLQKVFPNRDQINALKGMKRRGIVWSDDTVKTALSLRFSCGTQGYESLLALRFPYPSIRTLQRRLEDLKFGEGVLNEVLEFLKVKISSFCENEKKCVLLLDEMSITPSFEYDSSTCTYLGSSTSPFAGSACSALVFMIRGISSKWKQVIAYYYTSKEVNGDSLKLVTQNIIHQVESLGLQILGVTSDMSTLNQGMWKSFGIVSNRTNTIPSVSSPVEPERPIYFMADPPHLLKNIRSSLLANNHFEIPEILQQKYRLPSNKVSAVHIHDLAKRQEGDELKLAPKLTSQNLEVGHFDKMKVGPAHTVLSHDVSCALEFLAEASGDGLAESYATSWFIGVIDKWFALMTSRSLQMALSHLNMKVYQSTLDFLNEVIFLFRHMKIVQKNGKVMWKPIQTGVILSTISILKIQEKLLRENFKFVLTSRFTQDAIENLFGIVRSKQVIPTPLQFKYNLKLIAVSQFLKKCSRGSYETDDGEFIPGFLEVIQTFSKAPKTPTVHLSLDWDSNLEEVQELSLSEKNSLFNIAGYIIGSINKSSTVCQTCISSVASKTRIYEEHSKLVELREYKVESLLYVSNEVFAVFTAMELLFRSIKSLLLESNNCKQLLIDMFSNHELVKSLSLPSCHNIKKKIISRFAVFRLKIYSMAKQKEMRSLRKKSKPDMSSKSMGMRDLAQNVE